VNHDKKFSELVVIKKIEDFLNAGRYADIEDFIRKNPNFITFLRNNKLDTVLSHSKSSITEEDYINIITKLKLKYKANTPISSNTEIKLTQESLDSTIILPTIKKIEESSITDYSTEYVPDAISTNPENNKDLEIPPKQFLKGYNNQRLKNGFIDAAILAFVTGSFFGALFINLYIKIMHVIH